MGQQTALWRWSETKMSENLASSSRSGKDTRPLTAALRLVQGTLRRTFRGARGTRARVPRLVFTSLCTQIPNLFFHLEPSQVGIKSGTFGCLAPLAFASDRLANFAEQSTRSDELWFALK